MKKITIEEMRAYILAQPDDKPVDMGECQVESEKDCGCLMVQYARDYLCLRDEIHCGWFAMKSRSSDGGFFIAGSINFPMVDLIVGGFQSKPKTFGDLKKLLRR